MRQDPPEKNAPTSVRLDLDKKGEVTDEKLAEQNTDSPTPQAAGQRTREEPICTARAPTSPSAFSAYHESRNPSQNKAEFTSSNHYTIVAAPGQHHTAAGLHFGALEEGLVEKAMAGQPDRGKLGLGEVVVRDVVNSVVRDIVGTFEALLDRLLMEKKQDTIRTMVAELLTTDLQATLATGREQLKKEELGHIVKELSRVRIEIEDMEAEWEKRFKITEALRDSQDDLWGSMNERYKEAESRLTHVERSSGPRAEEAIRRVDTLNEKLVKAEARFSRIDNENMKLQRRIDALEASSKDTFATRVQLEASEQRSSDAVKEARKECEQGLQDLRKHAAADLRVAELEKNTVEQLKEAKHTQFEDRQEIDTLSVSLKKCWKTMDEAFVTKIQEAEHIKEVKTIQENSRKELEGAIDHVRAVTANKDTVLNDKTEIHKLLNELKRTCMENYSGLKETEARVAKIEEYVEQSSATKEYAYQTAKTLAHQVANECDEKEEIAQLRREFEEEHERLRQSVRQQQITRKDLNDAREDLELTRVKCSALDKWCGEIADDVKSVDNREADHWDRKEKERRQQKQKNIELDELYKALKEEFRSHQAFQKHEGEELRHKSTQRYLEQMDRAIGLTKSVQKIEKSHEELSETLSQSQPISQSQRLPPITPR